ncbi:hypothetical protein [Janibacter melonis]|uniref:hypothetical protein n=1 Tax=Janibacter melonis TaxID=262209 RepID=UPI00174E095F|nr:hypothetical protein [Janibacter melonis]
MSAAFADMTFPEHRRRISAEQRLEIRQRYRAGDLLTDIAKDYDVTQSAISYHVRDIHEERATKTLAPCGTYAAFQRHRAHGEPVDQACLDAKNAYTREYQRQRNASKARTSLDIERLKQLAEQGLDRIQIGAELGCSRKTVSKVAKAHDIALTPARSNQTALKPVAAREDPVALTGGRWVTGRHGIKRWKKD